MIGQTDKTDKTHRRGHSLNFRLASTPYHSMIKTGQTTLSCLLEFFLSV